MITAESFMAPAACVERGVYALDKTAGRKWKKSGLVATLRGAPEQTLLGQIFGLDAIGQLALAAKGYNPITCGFTTPYWWTKAKRITWGLAVEAAWGEVLNAR